MTFTNSLSLPFLTLLTLTLLTLTLAQDPTPSPGLTRDFCASKTDCQRPRACYVLDNATLLPADTPCPEFDACRCVPPSYTACTASEDCKSRETCARTVLFPFVCTSIVHVQSLKGSVVTSDDSPSNPLVPACAPPSTPVNNPDLRRNGLVLDPCLPGTCAAGLSCVFQLPNSKFQCCADGECVCHAPDTRPVCKDSSDCNPGEVCGIGPTLPQQCYGKRWMRRNRPALWKSLNILAAPTPNSDKTPPKGIPNDDGVIVTPAPVTSPAPSDDVDGEGEEEEEAVCVDAEALSHLSADQLVFEKHRLGRVLCDVNGSCATSGHIVVYKASAMMMKSYCEMAGCVERVIRVNSVRYRRALLTASKTHGLSYTALAARFATRAEEGVLAAAVRLGL